MKNIISLMFILALLLSDNSRSYAIYDILREIDDIVDASKPNVLLIVATDKFMTRPASSDGTGAVNENQADDSAVNSRFYMVKDVLAGFSETGVLDVTKDVINYGLMSYNQDDYYPYYHDHGAGSGTIVTSSGLPGGYQGDSASFGGPHNNLPYYFKYYSDLATYPPFNAKYPIEPADAGKVLIKIDTDSSLTQNGPQGAADSDADEVEVIEKFLDLQKNGGLALDDAAASDSRVDDVFKKTGDGDNYNDAYEYFSNVVIPGDTYSNSGCFTKNYIIYLADGFGANAAFTAAANNANDLYNLTVGGNSAPVKTFVIGVLQFDPDAPGNFGSLREKLNEIARKGGTDASDPFYGLEKTSIPGTASCKTGSAGCSDYAFFVKDRAELKEAFLDIAAAIAAGDFVTGAPTATSSGSTFVTNDVGILASAEYPEWRGHLRAVDLINDRFWWDAGTTLFIPASDTNLPKATVNTGVADLVAGWQDTDGDGTVDQPPLTLTVGGDTYQYTDRVLYCETGTDCNSSELISYNYIGSTPTFTIDSVAISYTYKGAFYLKPWGDRNVYTSKLDGSVLNFTTANWSQINTLAGWGVAENNAKAIINFALGGMDNDADGTVDSAREWWLGDITNIVPVSVGKPIEPEDSLSGRDTFQNTYSSRSTIVYTGSNDMMLHAYNFETGDELFAYIPPDLLSNLKTLYDNAVASADPVSFTGQESNPTDHIFGISASPKANDVQFADGTWHTVLVAGEGPGGNHYFALDITDPSQTFGTSGTNPYTVLWHTKQTTLAGSYGSTLGETWSVPAFGRWNDGSANGIWVVFAGSGYDDTNYADTKGEIYHTVNIETGALIKGFNVDAVSPDVQYGLLADSVSIIKKSGSTVQSSYQVDLEGRVWHIDNSDSNSTNWPVPQQLTKAGVLPTSNTGEPFYYSPSVWDYDYETTGSLNLMVLGSGAYEDPEMEAANNAGIASDLTTTLYFSIINPSTPTMTDAISAELSSVTGTLVDTDGSIIGAGTSPSLSNAKLIASPVIFNNKTSGNIEALFLVFDPPAAGQLGCSYGGSYLLVFNMGTESTFTGVTDTFDTSGGSAMSDVSSGQAQYVVSMGSGKVSGIGLAGGASHAVVGESGRGAGSTSGFNIAGGSAWNPVGEIKKHYWKDISN